MYLCAFGRTYFREAMVSIHSWRRIGRYAGQIVLFCDHPHDVRADLPFDISALAIDLRIVGGALAPNRARDAAAFRLHVFDLIEDDAVFVYCDTDIVCRRQVDIDKLLRLCDLDKVNVYGYPDRTQDSPLQAGFVTRDPRVLAQPAICSGFQVFTRRVRDDFAEIRSRYAEQPEVNSCWEQPMFNFVTLKNGSAHIALTPLFQEERNPAMQPRSAMFNHFCGVRSERRYRRMITRCDEYSMTPVKRAWHTLRTRAWQWRHRRHDAALAPRESAR